MHRWANQESVVEAIEAAENEARVRRLNRDMRYKLTLTRVGEVFADAPSHVIPPLIGLSEAAEIVLGRKERKGHLSRLRDRGVLPEAVAEISSGPVFVRAEMEEAARRLRLAMEAREQARAERILMDGQTRG